MTPQFGSRESGEETAAAGEDRRRSRSGQRVPRQMVDLGGRVGDRVRTPRKRPRLGHGDSRDPPRDSTARPKQVQTGFAR